jgi:ribosomal protein L19
VNKVVYKEGLVTARNEFYTLNIKKGDIVLIEYYTEGKYQQTFNGICVEVMGKFLNKRIRLFNLDEKIESIFFLNSPNIIKLEILNSI